MWSARCLLFLRQTGSRFPILEVCKVPIFQFHDCGEHIFLQIVTKIPNWIPILVVSQLHLPCFSTDHHKNSNRFKTNLHWLYLDYQRNRKYKMILEMCEIQFWQFHDCGGHIFPRIVAKIRHELKLINVDFVFSGPRNRKYNSDFREMQISFSVSLVFKRLCMQFFTWYHKILRAAVKCGRLVNYCFCDKPEVDIRF